MKPQNWQMHKVRKVKLRVKGSPDNLLDSASYNYRTSFIPRVRYKIGSFSEAFIHSQHHI